MKRKSAVESLDPEDELTEYLLASEVQLSARSGPSWRVFVLSLALTSLVSALLATGIGDVARLDADAFSIRHTSQYCELTDHPLILVLISLSTHTR